MTEKNETHEESEKKPHDFIWHSEVRGYELDLQGIVNNANYFRYFDHVRVLHFIEQGIDWAEWHEKGFDFVLAHTDMSFKASLKAHDSFYVTSQFERAGKIRLMFTQDIYRKPDGKHIARAINTLVCVSQRTGKPSMPPELEEVLRRLKNSDQ